MRPRLDEYFVDKHVVITGGSSGIGLALGEELLARRARIAILADKAGPLAEAVQQLRDKGGSAAGYVCDIGVAESVADAAKLVLAEHGPPDIVVNNAGFALYRTFEQEQPSEVERLMSVNFAGAIRVTKTFLAAMIENGGGQIVNVASIAGALPITPCAVYGAAKHGMIGWSRCIAPELARFGIHVTVICPGRIETNFFNHESFQQRSHRKETELTVPMRVAVSAIVDAIIRRQAVRFIPRYYGVMAWAYNALGPLGRAAFSRLSRSRIDDIYRDSSAP